jgi:CheY-like chemotaxis protein
MGLASVHGIVHELGGHIVVDTTPGKGTRFCVLFPALAGGEDLRVEASAAARAQPPRLAGRVLVVDDEEAVGAFMEDLLESWGLEVRLATNAADALTLIGSSAEHRFDLVITDQMMPRITGIQMARALGASHPDIPIILYTGLNEAIPRDEIEDAGLRAVITKPIDPHALFGLLQTHLPA